jgi:hypothetical protein
MLDRYHDFDYWPEEKHWVVEVFARDTLPGGAYRIAKIVSGPHATAGKAKADAESRNAQVSQKDLYRTGRIYLPWSDGEIKAFKERGTTLIGRME